MKIYFKYDYKVTCEVILREQLNLLKIPYSVNSLGEFQIDENTSCLKKEELKLAMLHYGITILDDQKIAIIELIKQTIDKLILEENSKDLNISTYLSSKLNYTYSHLSKIFTEANFSSINNYYILRKVDIAKDLIIRENLTLTEIAYKLNYSSVAHLSSQFKKITGFTPSDFERIFRRKKNYELKN